MRAPRNYKRLEVEELTVHTLLGPTDEYDDSGSYQPVAADLNANAAAGTSDSGDSAYLAGVMGNILSADMTHTGNYCAGVIGAYNVTGTNAATYPTGAVIGEIGDQTTTADGSFVACIGGDGGVTTAGAAFKVMSNNSTGGSGYNFGLDLQDAAHDGYAAVNRAFYIKAEIRLTSDVLIFTNAGAPSNGATLDNVAGKGSLCVDSTNGTLYINTGTITDSTWTVVGSQS